MQSMQRGTELFQKGPNPVRVWAVRVNVGGIRVDRVKMKSPTAYNKVY